MQLFCPSKSAEKRIQTQFVELSAITSAIYPSYSILPFNFLFKFYGTGNRYTVPYLVTAWVNSLVERKREREKVRWPCAVLIVDCCLQDFQFWDHYRHFSTDVSTSVDKY
jgi:hypothetical protein